MKKILALFLALTMVLPIVPVFKLPVAAATSGTTGDCIWTLNGTTLTIFGNGAMENYDTQFVNNAYVTVAPWGIDITKVVIEKGVTRISDDAFRGCDSLTSVTIPDSVTEIGFEAFFGCENLSSVMIPNSVTDIGIAAFELCENLTSVTIPDSVTTIWGSAFSFSGLTSVTIPDSVTEIGNSAFSDCDSLTSVTIPSSVTEIGKWAFKSCSSLIRIYVDRNNPNYSSDDYGVLFDKQKTQLLQAPGAISGPYTIPSSVTTIGDHAFAECDGLTGVTIPNSVTSISYGAFSDCWDLTTALIPSSVTSIGDFAFNGCPSLTSITIPDSVAYIGEMAFHSCSSLTGIYVDGNNPNYSSDDYGVLFDKQKTKLIQAPRAISGSYTIPSSVTTIEWEALFGCSNLTGIYVDGNNPNYSSDDYGVLFDKQKTKLIQAPGAISGSYTIPSSVTTISYGAFAYCHGLISVNIPDSVTNIEDFGFYNCNNLKIISFKGRAPSIELNTFGYTIATAYYPTNNSTWTADVMQDYGYGGTITWIPYDLENNNIIENGLVLYSDYNNLSIRKDSIITLTAGIFKDGEQSDDVSGINFQIEDVSILEMFTTDTKDHYRYVKFKGLTEGTTTVAFTDSNTGHTAKVSITVYDDNYLSYTLNSVPTLKIEKYPTNIYNANGLYIDSYEYTVNDDQSATVSFDVYNTNYIYGAVEVFDPNGNMKDAVLIEKMTSSNTSIKEALWDNIGYLVRDIIDGDLLSYRQESGYSKKTSVSVKIPKNGYIKISTDPKNSLIVGLVNSVNVLMSMASLAGDIKDFDANSREFTQKLTKKLLTDQIYVELVMDGSNASEDLWKNVGKEIFITSESMGNFTDTIAKNLDELKLGSIIADTAADFGWDIGKNIFTHFAGPVGTALNIMFTIGKVENLIIQQNDLIQSAGVGSIYIQNQGGGIRSCQQIKVECEDSLSSDTALSIFTVTLDSTIIDIIKDLNPEIYEAMSNGINRTYNISLIKNGDETQPNGKVTVYIPISKDFKALAYAGELAGKIKIYRVEEDGGLTEMDVEIENGCFVFTTDHFSLYTIVGYDFKNTQNDEKINLPLVIGVTSAAIVVIGAICFGLVVIIQKRKKSRK